MRVAAIFDRCAKELSPTAQDWGPEEYIAEAKEAVRIATLEMPMVYEVLAERQWMREYARHWWWRRTASIARQLRRRGRY